jgi:hypothetical protein
LENINILNATKVKLKIFKMANFMLCIFYQNKKKIHADGNGMRHTTAVNGSKRCYAHLENDKTMWQESFKCLYLLIN